MTRHAEVRHLLVELLRLLEIEHFNVLIDEWSTLDPSAATAVQPEFAELIKRTLGGAPGISVKIATNRYQTRLNNRGDSSRYRGLEVGADIFVAANLDRALLGRVDLVAFYQTLLFRRMRHCETDLRIFDPHGRDEPDRAFLYSMFRDERAFAQLVKRAEGIPRDFLTMFKHLARRSRYQLEHRWTATEVVDLVREASIEGQDEIEYESVASQLLGQPIKDVITNTRSRMFVVMRDDYSILEDGLDELLEKRLIHEYPREDLATDVRDLCRAYLVDYGLWLDWERALAATHTEGDQVAADVPPSVDRDNLHLFAVDAKSIRSKDLITCGQCDAVFSAKARSFQLEKLCPECFRPAIASSDAGD